MITNQILLTDLLDSPDLLLRSHLREEPEKQRSMRSTDRKKVIKRDPSTPPPGEEQDATLGRWAKHNWREGEEMRTGRDEERDGVRMEREGGRTDGKRYRC